MINYKKSRKSYICSSFLKL